MTPNKDFTISLYNPGSLGRNHDELIVAMSLHSVDILAVNETWLRPNEEDKAPHIPGYSLRSVPRPTSVRGGRGGGVAFYVRKGLYVRNCTHPVCTTVEQMWIRLNVNGVKIVMGTAYRPPWLDVDVFFNALMDSINTFSNYDNLILAGDFNIDLFNESSVNCAKLKDFLKLFSLEQLVTSPTHFTEYSETLLDVVCTDARVRAVSTDIIGSKLTNHAFIVCEFNLKRVKVPPRRVNFRPLKDIDLIQFERDIGVVPWLSIKHNEDVNEIVPTLNSFILQLFDIHAPVKSVIIRHNSYPWITDNLKFMMGLRNEAHLRYYKTKKDSHLEYYRSLKSTVNSTLNKEKRAYFEHHINSILSEPKTLWKNLKRNVLPRKSNGDLPVYLTCAEEINKHFLELSCSGEVDTSTLTFYESHRYGTSTFGLRCVNEQAVLRAIASLK